MNKSFFSEILQRKPILLQKICLFNACDPEIKFSENILQLKEKGADLTSLAKIKAVKERYKVRKNHITYWDFTENTKRIILFEPEAIKQLALYFGVTLNADVLSKIILQEEVKKIKNELGENLYEFALMRANFMINKESKFFKIFYSLSSDKVLVQKIILNGLSALYILCEHWPEYLKQRLETLLYDFALEYGIEKKECETLFSDFNNPPSEIKKYIWYNIQKIAVKELKDLWVPYFN